MKKILIIVSTVLVILVALYTIVFMVDYNRCSNLKLPIFALKVNDGTTYYGLGYSVRTESVNDNLLKVEMYILNKYIIGSITDYEEDNKKEENFGRVIMVNDKLYYDTGKKSNFVHTCGTMDGYIMSNVSSNTLPTKNNEANFEGKYGYQYGESNTIELYIDNEWYVFKLREEVSIVPTLDDKISDNTIWCGTFQLIWNDLKNNLAKQDIKFEEDLEVVNNLNKETFTTNDISDKYYYKKYGTPTLELKAEIEREIKRKFNEESDILNDFDWQGRDPKDFFLYVMLKKDFEFKSAFEKLENSKFGEFENIEYFGIKENSSNKLRDQVEVLYYNSKNDFAILLETKGDDEIILCKNPKGDTFSKIYKNILEEKDKYSGNLNMKAKETLKIPNINFKEKKEFKEIENKSFYFSNGDKYSIEKALQTIEFKLDRKGGKIKSEAGMMVKNEMGVLDENIREFSIDDTFAIFLLQEGKEVPYFANKINDISKFQ